MEALETIFSRRSIRRYKPDRIAEEHLETILRAGMSAPSAGNQKPWHFLVLSDPELIRRVPEIHPYANMLKQAPAAVLVCGDTRNLKHRDFWVQDCSAATENILLAAHALGLGAVWLGIYPLAERTKAFVDMFQLPEGVLPLSCISLGYPDEEKVTADRFDSQRVHRNQW